MKPQQPTLTVIVPACNEEAYIGPCLRSVLACDWSGPGAVEVIVAANGCTDRTAAEARALAPAFDARGWPLIVLELAEGNKVRALNAADDRACGAARLYLDADVTVAPAMLAQIAAVLDGGGPRYASGTLEMVAHGVVARAYARIWRRVPFMRDGVPGCGLFAVNAAGRARWGAFPDIISDDLFVRLHFAPAERHRVPAPFQWPLARGARRLFRVRRRQDAGVHQLAARYPDLMTNEDAPAFGLRDLARVGLRDPAGLIVYAGIAVAVRLFPAGTGGWARGR